MHELVQLYYSATPIVVILATLHVLFRSRQFWWLLAIFFLLPPLGAIVYLLIVALPNLRGPRGGGLRIPVPQAILIRRAEGALAELDSLDNRSHLAALYARSGRHEEAIALLEPSMSGLGARDPYVLLAFAQSCFASGDDTRALECLDQIDELGRSENIQRRLLLRAEIAHRHDGYEAAKPLFEQARRGFPGEEATAKQAWYCLHGGDPAEAGAIAGKQLAELRRSAGKYRHEESEWIALMRSIVKEAARDPDGGR